MSPHSHIGVVDHPRFEYDGRGPGTNKLRGPFSENDFFRRFLPYTLLRLQSGKWLPLNRDYKPLGLSSKEWVDYEDYDDTALVIPALRDYRGNLMLYVGGGPYSPAGQLLNNLRVLLEWKIST